MRVDLIFPAEDKLDNFRGLFRSGLEPPSFYRIFSRSREQGVTANDFSVSHVPIGGHDGLDSYFALQVQLPGYFRIIGNHLRLNPSGRCVTGSILG